MHPLVLSSYVFFPLHVLLNNLQPISRSVHTTTDYTVCPVGVAEKSYARKSSLLTTYLSGSFRIFTNENLAKNLMHDIFKLRIELNQINSKFRLTLSQFFQL